MSRSSVNNGRLTYCATLATPWGSESAFLSQAEAAAYQSDPDGFAASHFGLELSEYLEWLDVQGAALCGARTREGALCKNMISEIQQKSEIWKDLNRKGRCHVHG